MLRAWRRLRLARSPLPVAWEAILAANVPLSAHLPDSLCAAYRQAVQIFLAEKHFEGCGGLEVSEEMRVTIAGQACLLLVGLSRGYFPLLETVILYPESFAAPVTLSDRSGVLTERVEERLGESCPEGAVILAWDSIAGLASGRDGGCNVVIHEFAHQLDHQLQLTAGRLQTRQECRDWEELLCREKGRARSTRRRGTRSLLDPYAFTSSEELFAVASETFFTHPRRLRSAHPELYTELAAVYRLDPAVWSRLVRGEE